MSQLHKINSWVVSSPVPRAPAQLFVVSVLQAGRGLRTRIGCWLSSTNVPIAGLVISCVDSQYYLSPKESSFILCAVFSPPSPSFRLISSHFPFSLPCPTVLSLAARCWLLMGLDSAQAVRLWMLVSDITHVGWCQSVTPG